MNVVNNIMDNFRKTINFDDLAYLALSSKIEGLVRDYICLEYTNKYRSIDSELQVIREFEKVDIAILENEHAKELIELKMGYVFDLIKKPSKSNDAIEWLKSDFNKSKNLELMKLHNGCSQTCILITMDVLADNLIDDSYASIFVNYKDKINSFMKRRKTEEIDVLENQKNRLELNFDASNYRIDGGYWGSGSYSGYDVNFYYWIIDKI